MSTDNNDQGDPAEAYWQRLRAAGMPKPKAKPGKPKMPEQAKEIDSTDPLALIVEAIRDNSDAITAAVTEMAAARHVMAEAERKAALYADAMSADLRSNTLALQQLTAGQDKIATAENARYWWGLGGFVGGMVILESLSLLWQHVFG